MRFFSNQIRGARYQRGVQDMEEEHAISVRLGDDACAGVAQFNCSMVAPNHPVNHHNPSINSS